MEHKSTFNRVADLYGSARPGYASDLVEDVCAFAELRAGDPIVEVGCGAGQATVSFAGRGYKLTALDPGAALIDVAKTKLAGMPDVTFAVTPFEAWSAEDVAFRLIYAAQSWHWIPRDVAFAKAADSLAVSGVLAVFGHVPCPLPDPLGSVFKQVYLEHIGVWGPAPETGYLPSGPFAGWFEESGRFGKVVHSSYSWNWKHTTSSYVAFARTRSDHQMMQREKLDALLSDVERAIEPFGTFNWPYETHLYMAKRI